MIDPQKDPERAKAFGEFMERMAQNDASHTKLDPAKRAWGWLSIFLAVAPLLLPALILWLALRPSLHMGCDRSVGAPAQICR